MASRRDDIIFPRADGVSNPATIIFLHGLVRIFGIVVDLQGDTGHGWADVIEDVRKKFPYIKGILPTAPVQPVTLNRGMKMTAWHDIVDLNDIDAQTPGIEVAKHIVDELIEQEIAEGVPANRIILGGFSQGAATSMWVGYQYPKTLGGVIAFSGYLPQSKKFPKLMTEEAKKTPLLLCHGTYDDVVELDFGKRAFSVLEGCGVPASIELFEGMGHTACPQELSKMNQFIAKNVPQ